MEISSTVEFVVEGGSIQEARGVDLSETGIGFQTDGTLTVALTVTVEDREITRLAKLVRIQRQADGTFTFGLEFTEPGA